MPAFLIYKTICVAFLSGILAFTSCVIGLSVSPDVDNVVDSFSWSFLWAYFELQRRGGGVEGGKDSQGKANTELSLQPLIYRTSLVLPWFIFSSAVKFLNHRKFHKNGQLPSATPPLPCSRILRENLKVL